MSLHGWEDMGIVSILGDYTLGAVEGDILEIGIGYSSAFLSALAKYYERNIFHCDSDNDKIDRFKVMGTFAQNAVIYRCLSQELFKLYTFPPLAFAFIDGYHRDGQYEEDFWNIEKYLVPNGCVLMHDTYPKKESMAGLGSNGTVYEFRQKIEQDKRFDVFTFVGKEDYVASTFIRKKPLNRPFYQE